MEQIYLTEDMEEPTIGGMPVGEIAYVVPWAVEVNQDRRFVINKSFMIDDAPAGTACLKIKKVKGGYLAYKPSLNGRKYISGKLQHDVSNYEYVTFTDTDFKSDAQSWEKK
jgi:hypothetical protein